MNRCSVCGRPLTKSIGIGPVCARKRRRYKLAHRINRKAKYAVKHDIFKESNGGSQETPETGKGITE